MIMLLNWVQNILDKFRVLDFLAPLALRLYLAPIFWVVGTNKLGLDPLGGSFSNVVSWFDGLGLPFPALMASLAIGTEIIGSIFLIIGLGVRWISIPLMITMLVATFSVHIENGWQAVTSDKSPFQPADIEGALKRLDAAKDILKEHGNYEWLKESGNFVISNNGIEWSITYFIMLLTLFFIGAGKYVSIDHYIRGWFNKHTQ